MLGNSSNRLGFFPDISRTWGTLPVVPLPSAWNIITVSAGVSASKDDTPGGSGVRGPGSLLITGA